MSELGHLLYSRLIQRGNTETVTWDQVKGSVLKIQNENGIEAVKDYLKEVGTLVLNTDTKEFFILGDDLVTLNKTAETVARETSVEVLTAVDAAINKRTSEISTDPDDNLTIVKNDEFIPSWMQVIFPFRSAKRHIIAFFNQYGEFVPSKVRVLRLLGLGQAEFTPFKTQFPLSINDSKGRAIWAISKLGAVLIPGIKLLGGKYGRWDIVVTNRRNRILIGIDLKKKEIHTKKYIFHYGSTSWPFFIADAKGFIIFGYKAGKFHWIPGLGGESAVSDIVSKDQRNRAWSYAKMNTPVTGIQYPIFDWNIFIGYGQSLAEGYETWPVTYSYDVYGTYMFGDHVDHRGSGVEWLTIGGDEILRPMTSATHDGLVLLTPVEEAALEEGAENIGTPPVEGMVRALGRWIAERTLTVDVHKLVAMGAGRGGASLAYLESGNDNYTRLLNGVQKVYNLVSGGATCGVSGVKWMGGEADAKAAVEDILSTRAGYKGRFGTFVDDIQTDTMDITQQPNPPAIFTYQTGGSYTRDVDADGTPGLAVPSAQVDLAFERQDVIFFAPSYPYVNKAGGHQSSNGSAAIGNKAGQAASRIFSRLGFMGTTLLELEQPDPYTVRVHCHVPFPPLKFKAPYDVGTAVMFDDKGFRITSPDALTSYPIYDVILQEGTIIDLKSYSQIPGISKVWYADLTVHNGYGNICDSDPFICEDLFRILPGHYDQPAEEDGKPLDSANWLAAFCETIGFTRY